MKRLALIVAWLGVLAYGDVLPFDMRPETNATLPGITILDQKRLVYDRIAGVPFSEVSDLAYLPKTHTLILLSDRGRLYDFSVSFANEALTLTPRGANRLRRSNGKGLRKNRRDSEGLTVDGAGNLFASFEGKPRVANLDRHGRIIQTLTLPRHLRSLQEYRSRNKGLEALTYHPKYGLLAAKERPGKGPLVRQAIYSLEGRIWRFRAENIRTDSVTAIASMDDGNVLVLERAFVSEELLGVITLKKVYLNEIKNGWCRSKVLGQLRTDRGWRIDNFEGLARVAPRRYVMVSDDNNNFFQKTLLVYFEIK